jgi:hypothetical protein
MSTHQGRLGLTVAMSALVAVASLATGCASAAASEEGATGTSSAASSSRKLFVTSATENADGTVTLPLYKGTSHGDTVYYIVLDASDGNVADRMGVNTAQKLANATTPGLVQSVASSGGALTFPATVDFSPTHVLSAPGPFPPAQFAPGAIGEAGYSPLVRLADGTVLNAPQIARDQNHDGRIDLGTEAADKVVSIDTQRMVVHFQETPGFSGGKPVLYVSTDSSDLLAASLEDVTYAPALNLAPSAGDDSSASSRAALAAFVNGQTGPTNPQRQGLNSAVAGDGSPFNVLAWTPNQGRYSPLWDVHLAAWSAADVASGKNLRQTDFGTLQGLADHGDITAPDGRPFAATGFVVNCPIISGS